MPRTCTLLVIGCLACGDDEAPSDSGPGDAAIDGASTDADAATDGGVPSGDRLGLFGPAPSYFELFVENEADATVDGFHLGTSRSGFTWPIPFALDHDGDGYDEVGYFDPAAGRFLLEGAPDGPPESAPIAAALPLAGNWDDDPADELGLYDPVTGESLLLGDDGAVRERITGPVERFAFAADVDGDGHDDIVYYDGATFDVEGGASGIRLEAPEEGYPFAFDQDGDGRDGVGLFDVDDQTFHLFSSLDGSAAPEVIALSPTNWIRLPVAGRWRATAPRPIDTGYPHAISDPGAVGGDAAGLDEAASELAAMPNLRSLLVFRDGSVIHETYFHGNRPEIAHNVKSVSKSILATVLALSVDDGTVRDLPITSLLPAIPHDGDPRRDRITLGHLSTMTAGLSWSEDAIGDWFTTDDWVAAAFAAPMVADPGSTFNYSTGNTHLASVIIERETGRATDAVARDRLLSPLGITAERWDHDPAGHAIGGAEVTMRPRDLVRFGQLFLEDGAPGGERIIDGVVIDAVRTQRIEASRIDGDLGYGAWWWMRSFGGADAYFAWGYGGQLVLVFDDLRSVVVVTSRSDVDGATSTAVSYSIFSVITDHVVPALGG